MGNARNDYFWIVGGGLLQTPLVPIVRELGFKVIISDGSAECACREDADLFAHLDIFDIPAHLRKADEYRAQGIQIRGVLAAGIDAPETMARLARHLGLPGVDPEVAHLVNNKHKFREALRKLGYPTPKFRIIDASVLSHLESTIDEISSDIGFPLIIKNTDSSGSRGTRIFKSKDVAAMAETLRAAIQVSRSKKALIEECWVGPEQTVETIFDIHGKFYPCFITDRFFDKGDGYAMETGLRHPSALPKQTQEEMFDVARRIAIDLGVKIGAAKFDMMLTKDGPRVIEMTVRLSGGFDSQYLVPAATGKNVLKAAVLTALGREFEADLLIDHRKRVGLTTSLWPKPGKIHSISGLDEIKKIDGFEHVFFRYKVGDVVAPYTDCTKRVCFLIATGRNEDEAKKALDRIASTLKIETA